LLVGDPLLPNHSSRIQVSRVVHKTVDPEVSSIAPVQADDEDGAETDPDLIITNARMAEEKDGLLTDAELVELFTSSGPPAVSAYDSGMLASEDPNNRALTWGSRVSVPPDRKGGHEPVWTSYTHYWKTVLDYIFVLSPQSRAVSIDELAKPHPTSNLDPGIPRKGVCGSDHISLCAELSWSPRESNHRPESTQ